MMFTFEGLYTPVITPMGVDGEIDYPNFKTQLDLLVAEGIHGIIVGGTTGESYAMSQAERMETIRFASGVLNARLPLIAGVGTIRTEDGIELATAARESGANALLLGSPAYACPTEEENAMHALAIADAADLPVMLYNYPGRSGSTMGQTYLDIVTTDPRFCAIKESSGDINAMHRIAADYPSLQLSCGADDQALEFFAWGARSWVCGGSNFLPKEHAALYEACVIRNDFNRGRQIMRILLPLMRMLEQGGKFVQSIKNGCEWAGLAAGPVRRPLQNLSEAARVEQIALLDGLRAKMDELLASFASEDQQQAARRVSGYA
jgi:4-hydroxy-tetrahydrodipicolinate synthase